MNTIHLADNLLKLRHNKKVTQEELANYLGVTKASVSKWENAQSYPDLTLLPQLAAYFNVTVDELIGYEALLSTQQITKVYQELCSGFAAGRVEESFQQAREYIRSYYSCYEFLSKMIQLYLNHHFLLESPQAKQGILEESKELCNCILENCNVQEYREQATYSKAVCDLMLGHPEEVIESFEPICKPLNMAMANETLLVQAYQLKGQLNRAEAITQMGMYNSLISEITHSISYLSLNVPDLSKCTETIKRISALIELYKVINLNPNLTANFFYQAAICYVSASDKDNALKMLAGYVQSVCQLFRGEIKLHGDDYFNLIEGIFLENDAQTEAPRDRRLIANDAIMALSNPVFQSLSEEAEFKLLITKVKKGVD